ncbi:putative uncharacterized transposon-derived protein F52C9.6, partial [Varanus komodoensis]
MRKVGLDESPVRIKIAGRNINSLRYADDTILMAESAEELKSLLMRAKEENTKVGLKLNIKKTKTMASGPPTSWQIDGEEMEVVTDFIFLGSKITADGDCSQEIEIYLLLGRKAMANLDSILKSTDITLPTEKNVKQSDKEQQRSRPSSPTPEQEHSLLPAPHRHDCDCSHHPCMRPSSRRAAGRDGRKRSVRHLRLSLSPLVHLRSCLSFPPIPQRAGMTGMCRDGRHDLGEMAALDTYGIFGEIQFQVLLSSSEPIEKYIKKWEGKHCRLPGMKILRRITRG